jgi:hypothetical protein
LDTAEDTGRPGSKKKEGWWISMHSGEEDTGGGDQSADSGKEEAVRPDMEEEKKYLNSEWKN